MSNTTWHRPVWLAGVLLGLLVSGCRGVSPAKQAAEEWSQGPAVWLLLHDERRELAAIRGPADFEAFRQAFWSRRDPSPSDAVNPAADRFFERVADADQLYIEEGQRGSVTDRGGALILLGSPNILRHQQKRVPALGTAPVGDGPRPTVRMTEEVWVYFTQDLPPALRELLRGDDGPLADIALTFALESDGARLTQGREFLRLARDSWVTFSPGAK